jgi:acetyl-CoA acetyltransferase
MRDAWISGAAMTRFGKHAERGERELVEEAVAGALADAGLVAADVQCVYVANAAAGLIRGQESIRGQVVLRNTGLMGTPIINVENADASGSTALHLAWQAVAGGMHDCVLVLGYEKLDHVNRVHSYRAVNATMDLTELADVYGPEARNEPGVLMNLYDASPVGGAGDRFTPELLAEVSVKNHHHGVLNPRAHYREAFTVEQVLGSRVVAGPLTRLMCAPFSDGAACVVLRAGNPLASRSTAPAVRVAASILGSGRGDDLGRPFAVIPATLAAYERAGVGPEDLDVVELHDATTITELLVYERLGLCPDGEAERLIRDRTTWLGGELPVNPSGGLLARGHPHGATGVAQVVELVWQLRGGCGDRQVPTPRCALAHNTGGWVGTDVGAVCIHVLTV